MVAPILDWLVDTSVVPRGDEEIRTQINADHTEADIDHVLGLLEAYGG